MTACDRNDDEGFTLVELIVVMALVALVVPTLAIGLITYFTSTFKAAARSDQAHHSRMWATALQRDLASAKSATTAGGGCAADTVLILTWSQPNPLPNGQAGTPDNYQAVYSLASATGTDAPYVLNRTLTANSTTTTEPVARNVQELCDVAFSATTGVVRASVTQKSPAGPSDTTQIFGRVGVRQ